MESEHPSSAVELKANGMRVRIRRREALLVAVLLGTGGSALALRPALYQALDIAEASAVERVASDVRALAELPEQVESVEKVAAQQATSIAAIVATVGELRDGMHEDRAERLADQAEETERDPRKRRAVWKRVRAKALANQKAGLPLRDGLTETFD